MKSIKAAGLALMFLSEVAAQKPVSKNAVSPASESKTADLEMVKPVSRTVEYRTGEVVAIKTRLRFSTLFVFPPNDNVVDVASGDKDFWITESAKNFLYLKPAREKGQSNVNVITASGAVYSFLVTEGSPEPDVQVTVQRRDGIFSKLAKTMAVDDGAQCKAEVEALRKDAKRQKDETDAFFRVWKNAALQSFHSDLNFRYDYERGKPPRRIYAIFDDGRFTYIRAEPNSVGAVYETTNANPVLVQFEYLDGLLKLARLISSGYIVSGKNKLSFRRIGGTK